MFVLVSEGAEIGVLHGESCGQDPGFILRGAQARAGGWLQVNAPWHSGHNNSARSMHLDAAVSRPSLGPDPNQICLGFNLP